MGQFSHIVTCYNAVRIQILGFECNAGGQNARLLKYLRREKDLGTMGWLKDKHVLINHPANPMKKIAVWFFSTHQLKNMRNALLRCVDNNQHFSKDGVAMSWSVIVDTFKRDRNWAAPITDMTRAAASPDSWSKMNVSAAKAPFTYKTIIEMMTDLAIQLECVETFIHEKLLMDNCDIYLHHLSVLKEANKTTHGNVTTSTILATIEYCTHVAIIFNENLMNGELRLSMNNIDEHEGLVRQSMTYFEDWKKDADQSRNNKAFLSMITFSDLRICVAGFFAYACLVLNSGVAFIPMLHSNTSILEAFFSLIRSMKKETARDYPNAVSTIYVGTEVVALSGNQCKRYSEKDVAAMDDPRNNVDKALGWNDTKHENIMRKIKENKTIKNFSSAEQCAWKPFQSSTDDHGDITMRLCYMMESSTFVDAMQFWDIVCPYVANDISQRFENYCRMSIDTPTEQFFKSFYCLNDNEKTQLNAACRLLFDVLLGDFKNEIKKAKSTMI